MKITNKIIKILICVIVSLMLFGCTGNDLECYNIIKNTLESDNHKLEGELEFKLGGENFKDTNYEVLSLQDYKITYILNKVNNKTTIELLMKGEETVTPITEIVINEEEINVKTETLLNNFGYLIKNIDENMYNKLKNNPEWLYIKINENNRNLLSRLIRIFEDIDLQIVERERGKLVLVIEPERYINILEEHILFILENFNSIHEEIITWSNNMNDVEFSKVTAYFIGEEISKKELKDRMDSLKKGIEKYSSEIKNKFKINDGYTKTILNKYKGSELTHTIKIES